MPLVARRAHALLDSGAACRVGEGVRRTRVAVQRGGFVGKMVHRARRTRCGRGLVAKRAQRALAALFFDAKVPELARAVVLTRRPQQRRIDRVDGEEAVHARGRRKGA